MELSTYILIGLGVIALLGLLLYFVSSQSQKIPKPWVETEGEVLEIRPIRQMGINPINMIGGDFSPSIRYHPVVRFKIDTVKGVKFRNVKGYSDENRYTVGQKVRVIYSENEPLKAKIDD